MTTTRLAALNPKDGIWHWAGHGIVIAALVTWPLLYGQPRFFLHLGIMVCIYAVLAMSMNLVLRIGQLSLAHGAFFGVGAYASAILSRDYGMAVPLSFLGAGMIAALIAAITGPILMRIKGVHFALLTFALGEVIVLCFVEFHGIFGGNNGFGQIPAISDSLPLFDTRYAIYLLAAAFALVVYFALRMLYKREWGMIADSLHQNESLALAGGLSALNFRVSVYTASALLAGLAGSFYAHYHGYISPESFNFWTAVNAIIMNVLGGVGVLAGAVIGAAILVPLPELLRELAQYQRLIYGLTLMALLMFMPQGLFGLITRLCTRFKKGKA